MKKHYHNVLAIVFVFLIFLSLILIFPTKAAQSWSIQTLNAGGHPADSPSLALDSSGNPHISYVDSFNANLEYVSWTGSVWIAQTPATDVRFETSLVLDSNGNPRISYCDRVLGRLTNNLPLKYVSWAGSSAWNTQTVDDMRYSSTISLALDSSGNPHISYEDANLYLRYASWTGSTWSIQTVADSGPFFVFSSSLALDSSNNPHIAFDSAGNLRYASWTGSTWSIQYIENNSIETGKDFYPSLALDSSGNPHISYEDANLYLRYASWTGSTWNIQTVDSTGKVSEHTSLALDSSGNPHISYYDSTNGDLKYANYIGSMWNTQTIDSTGDVGRHSSLALDSSGNPHIAYLGDNGALKYAFFGTSQTQNTPTPTASPAPSPSSTSIPTLAPTLAPTNAPTQNPISPSPTVPEFPISVILFLFVAIPLITTVLLLKNSRQRIITR